jgi:hypothetical protein
VGSSVDGGVAVGDGTTMLRKALLGSVIALTAFAAAGEAASGPKRGLYEGHAKGASSRSDHEFVQLRVSASRKRLDFRGPHEDCNGGFNPVKAFFPRIDDVKIKRSGRFKAERKYTDTSLGEFYVLRWTVELSGRFKSNTTAKGKVTYEMSHQGRSPTEQFCGERTVTFTAKRSG